MIDHARFNSAALVNYMKERNKLYMEDLKKEQANLKAALAAIKAVRNGE